MNCYICGHLSDLFIDEKNSITYYHCKRCEFIFKDPKHYLDFDRQKERYDLHQNDEYSTKYRAYFQEFVDFISFYFPKVESALDFGCGCSLLLSKMLEERGVMCDYYDPLYYPQKIHQAKRYDLIVSTEVFEHLHQPKEVFSMLVDRLNSGGYLAIQTQFHNEDIREFKTWYYRQDVTHIVFFCLKTFSVLANQFACRLLNNNGVNMVILQKY